MRLVTVTGEPSGDLIASDALGRLINRRPELELGGIGGDRLASLGMDCWFRSDDLAVRGYAEAISKLVHIFAVRHWLLRYIDKWNPGVFLGVDAPDFNLGVEERVKAQGIRTVHLISPSIWAWRPERISKIKRAVDHMLCIFPFEIKVYEGTGVRATYVGHPIADMIPMEIDQSGARQKLSISGTRPVVAVLPGSRLAELKYNGPAFFGAAAVLAQDCEVVVPAASGAVARMIERHPDFHGARDRGVRLLPQQGLQPVSHLALASCDVALVASGTATLEAALFKRPMVIGYRVPSVTYWMMRRKAVIKDIGLPNILLGRRIVPEITQEQFNCQTLVSAVRNWLTDPAAYRSIHEQFTELHHQLRLDAASRIADILDSELAHASRR